MSITKKEKQIQKALGLEKGFVTRLSIEIPIHISVPIIVKGISMEEVRERLFNLSDSIKKRIIKHTCKVLMSAEFMCPATELGQDAIAEIETTSKSPIKNIDPTQLNDDSVDIDTDIDTDGTVTDVIEYLKEEMDLDDNEILII